MNRILTERERGIVALAGELADDFATRAAEHDRDATFPVENYERMRDRGYLGLTVPEELGGMGATLGEMLLAQERLAMGCSSTALAVNMHISPLGQLATFWRATGDRGIEEFLRAAARGEVIYASMSAERGHSILMTSDSVATRVSGGFKVSGEKIFGTASSICTHFSTMARYEDPDHGPRVLFFRLARNVEGMTVKRDWDTLGMRATQSNSYTLDDVFVPDGAIFHSYPVGTLDALMLKTVWGWAMPSFGAVYLGTGAAAMEIAREQVLARGRQDDPQVQHVFAEMEVLLETARAVLSRHAYEMTSGAIDDLPVQDGMSRAILTKYVACNNAITLVDRAIHIVGGAAYFRRLPLERLYRDVRAGTIQPYNNFEAENLFGKTSLGVEIAPEVPLDESGHRREARSSARAAMTQ